LLLPCWWLWTCVVVWRWSSRARDLCRACATGQGAVRDGDQTNHGSLLHGVWGWFASLKIFAEMPSSSSYRVHRSRFFVM
jgi:hypothetical protein